MDMSSIAHFAMVVQFFLALRRASAGCQASHSCKYARYRNAKESADAQQTLVGFYFLFYFQDASERLCREYETGFGIDRPSVHDMTLSSWHTHDRPYRGEGVGGTVGQDKGLRPVGEVILGNWVHILVRIAYTTTKAGARSWQGIAKLNDIPSLLLDFILHASWDLRHSCWRIGGCVGRALGRPGLYSEWTAPRHFFSTLL